MCSGESGVLKEVKRMEETVVKERSVEGVKRCGGKYEEGWWRDKEKEEEVERVVKEVIRGWF